jgi:serine protease AprX
MNNSSGFGTGPLAKAILGKIQMSPDRKRVSGTLTGFAVGGLAAVLALASPPCPARTFPADTAPPGRAGSPRQVIVTGRPGQQSAVAQAVLRAGGTVRRTLPVVHGVTALVPTDRLAQVESAPEVRAVSPDVRGRLLSVDPDLGYDVDADDGSLHKIAKITHARESWRNGTTGAGIDVALIDSGVAPVIGLTSGNVINGPDLSFESQNAALRHTDTYGHGTHLASIIVGRDVPADGNEYAKADKTHRFNGLAPDSRVISLKVAASDGGSDVSQVIAAIDWVTQHGQDNGLNIRVLNLAFGTDSTQPADLDPLCYAVENAWRAGIAVVVAGGNDGTERQELANPATSPLVMAVGASDPAGSVGIGNDVVPEFSQRGTGDRHVDLLAPGVHVLGLKVPNGAIDGRNPQARLGDRFFRGSGTSQAAAVVSGLAALYLSKYPQATPDQVKAALTDSAVLPSQIQVLHGGYGVPDIHTALTHKPPQASQPASGATGTGSLEAARGTNHVHDGYTELTGEQDIFGQVWDGATWAGASAAGTSWTGGDFNGATWTGTAWAPGGSNAGWESHAWSTDSWSSHAWSDYVWDSHAWSTGGWDSHAWSDSIWDSHAWSGGSWGSHAWSTAGWF